MDTQLEDKVKLIEAKHGLTGFAVWVKLLQKIYTNGYYINWKEEISLLFSSEVNVDINKVNDIINDCLNWEVFNKEFYKEHRILTSHGIQVRYKEATYRRKKVKIKEDYLLLSKDEINDNMVNDNNNPINVDNNSKKENNNKQSKVKESKVKNNTSSSNDKLENNHKNNCNKKIKIGDEKNENNSEIPEAFHKTFGGLISAYQMEILQSYIDDGISEKVVVLALKQAAKANAKSLNYVKKILDDWLERDIKTIKKAEIAIQKHKNSRTSPEKTPPKTPQQIEKELKKQGWR